MANNFFKIIKICTLVGKKYPEFADTFHIIKDEVPDEYSIPFHYLETDKFAKIEDEENIIFNTGDTKLDVKTPFLLSDNPKILIREVSEKIIFLIEEYVKYYNHLPYQIAISVQNNMYGVFAVGDFNLKRI